MNDVLSVKIVTPPGDEVKLTSKFVRSFTLWRPLKWSEDLSLN